MVEVVVVVVIRKMAVNQTWVKNKTAEETRKFHGIITPGGAKETKDCLSKTSRSPPRQSRVKKKKKVVVQIKCTIAVPDAMSNAERYRHAKFRG
jgi:hypothetical protein